MVLRGWTLTHLLHVFGIQHSLDLSKLAGLLCFAHFAVAAASEEGGLVVP
jgi:hypothetical protein